MASKKLVELNEAHAEALLSDNTNLALTVSAMALNELEDAEQRAEAAEAEVARLRDILWVLWDDIGWRSRYDASPDIEALVRNVLPPMGTEVCYPVNAEEARKRLGLKQV